MYYIFMYETALMQLLLSQEYGFCLPGALATSNEWYWVHAHVFPTVHGLAQNPR